MTWRKAPEELTIKDIQDGCSEISMLPKCLPSSFGSIRVTIWEQMSFEDFKDGHCGGHLGYMEKERLINSESVCSSNASH